MADEADVIVSLPAEEGATVTAVTQLETDQTSAAVSDTPPPAEEVFADLKRQLEAEQRKNADTARALADANRRAGAAATSLTAAQRAAADAANRANTAEAQRRESELDSVATAIASLNGELEALVAQKAIAKSEGKFADESRIDLEISRRVSRLDRLEDGKIQLEQAKKAPPTVVEQPAPTRVEPSGAEKRENFLSRLPTPSATWLRAHSQYLTDDGVDQRVMDAALKAEQQKGLSPYHADYFKSIEEDLGLRTPEQPKPQPQAQPETQRATVRAATAQPVRTAPAPAARPAAGSPGGIVRHANGQVDVPLTAAEIDHAKAMFPKSKPTDPDPLAKYAKHKADLIAEGKWPPFPVR
jgi:hypothetical protein